MGKRCRRIALLAGLLCLLLLEGNGRTNADVPKQDYAVSLVMRTPIGWKLDYMMQQGVAWGWRFTDVHGEVEGTQKHSDLYEHQITVSAYGEREKLPENQIHVMAVLMEEFGLETARSLWEEGEPLSGWIMEAVNPENSSEILYFLVSQKESGVREFYVVKEDKYYAYGNAVENFLDFADKGYVFINGGDEILRSVSVGIGSRDYYRRVNIGTDNEMLVRFREVRDADDKWNIQVSVYQKGKYEECLPSVTIPWFWRKGACFMDINGDGWEDFLPKFDGHASECSAENQNFEGYLWNPEENIFVYCPGEELLGKYRQAFLLRDNPGLPKEKLPEGLIAYLSELLVQDRDTLNREISSLCNSRELSDEEVRALAEEHSVIRDTLLETAANNGYSIWIMTDADNDGREDVFLERYMGGSMGLTERWLFRCMANGDYRVSYVDEGVQEEFDFLCWEGKNYLAQTTFDYNRKVYDGIRLTCFRNGIENDVCRLHIVPVQDEAGWHRETTFLAEDVYEKLCHFTIQYNGERLYPKTEFLIPKEWGGYPLGTAERLENNYCTADLDNDGEAEQYWKSVWEPSNIYTAAQLIFQSEDVSLEETVYELVCEEEGRSMLLWADETEFGNVTYVLYEEGLYDFYIVGYLGNMEGFEKMIQVDYHFELEIREEREEL